MKGLLVTISLCIVLYLFGTVFTTVTAAKGGRIMLLPLDERFTTRTLFLNMAAIVGSFQVITPPLDMICHLKEPANLTLLHQWVDDNIGTVDKFILSSEMYLYGGLIASRISNDTLDTVLLRLNRLAFYKIKYPKLEIYVTNVIMRIPAYSLDTEEPWYWAYWGLFLFKWSFYIDRYHVLGDKTDYDNAMALEKIIPAAILKEFLWRRERNHNVTVQLLEMQHKHPLFEKIWITLDDNAQYGLNKAEERQLRKQIENEKLWNQVNMYPGADEVQLTALSFMAVKSNQPNNPPKAAIIYRDSNTQNYIPNYEGQPLNVSVIAQIHAAGGIVVPNSQLSDADIIVLVNNWSTEHQQEAPQPQSPADYSLFEKYLDMKNKIFVYADVRYSNGGDLFFTKWIYKQKVPKLGQFTYAGWNTAGNTLGTCISNAILVHLFKNGDVFANNAKFQIYRFLEDADYQAWIRNFLQQYLDNVSHEEANHLDVDSFFYEMFVLKGLASALKQLQQVYPSLSNYRVTNLYFPWHRPFEIGFQVVLAL